MKRFFASLFICFAGLTLLGCMNSDMCYVTGTVTFDGKPVETGRILFRNTEGDKGYAGQINNGSYAVLCPPGKMRVEITASRIVPGKFNTENGGKDPVGEMYIPAKYNTKSELMVEVDYSSQEHPFDLKSK